jgi:hypothetical protein
MGQDAGAAGDAVDREVDDATADHVHPHHLEVGGHDAPGGDRGGIAGASYEGVAHEAEALVGP